MLPLASFGSHAAIYRPSESAAADMKQNDLFIDDEQQELFDEASYAPPVLSAGSGAGARAASRDPCRSESGSTLPWDSRRLGLYRTIFPQMTLSLPEEEGAQLRLRSKRNWPVSRRLRLNPHLPFAERKGAFSPSFEAALCAARQDEGEEVGSGGWPPLPAPPPRKAVLAGEWLVRRRLRGGSAEGTEQARQLGGRLIG